MSHPYSVGKGKDTEKGKSSLPWQGPFADIGGWQGPFGDSKGGKSGNSKGPGKSQGGKSGDSKGQGVTIYDNGGGITFIDDGGEGHAGHFCSHCLRRHCGHMPEPLARAIHQLLINHEEPMSSDSDYDAVSEGRGMAKAKARPGHGKGNGKRSSGKSSPKGKSSSGKSSDSDEDDPFARYIHSFLGSRSNHQ